MHRLLAIAPVLAAGLVAAAPAQAALVRVQFTISSDVWFESSPPPFGLPNSPIIVGQAVFDNSRSGIAAFLSLDFTTGTQAWNLDNYASAFIPQAVFGPDGNLTRFDIGLRLPGTLWQAYVSTFNTFRVGDASFTSYSYCNGCVSFTSTVQQVPAPGGVALFGLGLAGIAAIRHRRGGGQSRSRTVGNV